MDEINFDCDGLNFKFLYFNEYQNILKNFKKYFKIDQNVVLDVSFVTSNKIRELNKQYRNKDYVTDILSFDFGHNDFYTKLPFIPIGELIICPDKIKAQALEFNHSEKREYCYLFTHGLVHLMGYDHETEEERINMNKMVDEILAPFNITRE